MPSPPTTRNAPREKYAIRVSVLVPPQRGRRTFGRASDQRTVPPGVRATSSFARVATTKRPKGDHDASRYGPSSRFEPSCSTTHAPESADTSSRPGAGREKSAGALSSTPTTSRISSRTARPGGLSSPASTTSAAAAAASGFHERRRGCGSRSANAAETTAHVRVRAPCSFGSSIRSKRSLTATPRAHRARVAGAS